MKLTALFLTVGILSVCAKGVSQNVTFSGEKVTLKSVLLSVEKQTGFLFLYPEPVLQSSRPVSVNARNLPLDQFLTEIFRSQPLKYTIKGKSIFVSPKRQPSNSTFDPLVDTLITVRGKVLVGRGEPLNGANVAVKGTRTGTTTGSNGEFALKNVNPDAIVIISSVGFETQEIKVNGNNQLSTITLKPADSKLDEVQIIAYGTTSKRLSTGSIGVVKSEDLEKQPVGNLMAALEGLVPGLQITQQTGVPGGNFSVQLRGQNSIIQGSSPLFVVDGIPYPSNTLTQAVFNSALGSNGASPLNGINLADVESVTVLKDAAATSIYGARGANGVILITMKKGRKGATRLDANAYSGWGKSSRRLDLLNTSQYLAMRREAFKNGATTPNVSTAPDLLVWDTTAYTDWQQYFWGGTAHFNDIQASVSGGSGNTGFLLGGGYHEEGTVFPGDAKDKKAAMHFSVNHTSDNGRFKALLNGSFTNDKLNLPPQDFSSQITLAPNQPALLKADGSLNWPQGGGFNSLAYLKQPYNSSTDNLISNASLSYAIVPGLQVKVDMGYTNLRSTETQITPLSSINPANLSFTTSSANFGNSEFKVWNIEPQVSYSRHRGQHNLSVMVGSTIQSSFSKGMLINGSGFVNDALLNNIQAAKTITISTNTNSVTKDNSLFGRINYSYSEKYLVDLTARRDGSSRFGPGKQFGNFGAVGLGWVFTNESFAKKSLGFISFGKLRASYGTVGNVPGADYKYLSLWNTTTYSYNSTPNLYPANLFNEDYAWEVTHKLDLGADLEFLAGRIRLTADYYRNRSSNQLVTYNLPAITGFTGITANLPATVLNKGWELNLQTVNIDHGKFRWSSSLTFSAPKNELASFPGLETSSYSTQYLIGQPVYISRRYHYMGVNPQTGVYQYQTKAGSSSSPSSLTDRFSTYNPKPRYWGALGNEFSYKGFTLSVLFTYAKQDGVNTDPPVTPGSLGNLPVSYLDRWQKTGDVRSRQKISSPGYDVILPYFNLSTSDFFIQDASYIRLKNLALSYQLPASLASRAHIAGSKIYLQCQNLLTITGFTGLDPETQGSSFLPPLRVITAGIQFTL